jgi:pimeloyl-ACP methyl ester carboxylesterase
VVDALADVDEDVVLLGHSLGGVTIPLVAERRPVTRLIYLASLPPLSGVTLYESYEEYGIDLPEGFVSIDEGDGTLSVPEDISREWFFHDVSDELARWAMSKLRRQASLPMTEPSPLKGHADVPISMVACADDRALSIASVRKVAARSGLPVIELPGSHSPFLSRPATLAGVLVGI